jgi:hypothetical protein
MVCIAKVWDDKFCREFKGGTDHSLAFSSIFLDDEVALRVNVLIEAVFREALSWANV